MHDQIKFVSNLTDYLTACFLNCDHTLVSLVISPCSQISALDSIGACQSELEEMMDKHYENKNKVVMNRNYHFDLSVKTKFVDPVKLDQDFYSEKLCGNKT